MTIGVVMAAALAVAQPDGGGPAPPPPALDTSASATPASQAVTRYTPDAVASSQPSTALDLVGHLPGFTFQVGDSVRGFSGAAGNVLVDGARPASKELTLDEILKRIPVSRVLRVDVIRGGSIGPLSAVALIAAITTADRAAASRLRVHARLVATACGAFLPARKISIPRRASAPECALPTRAPPGSRITPSHRPRPS